jgi:hypothetical protein
MVPSSVQFRGIASLTGHNLSEYVRLVDDILDAIDRAALKKRGTLRAWMVENRSAFHDRLLTHKPDWPTLARVFTQAGLLDSRGNAPTAEATRKTWYRVQATEVTKKPPALISPASTLEPKEAVSDDDPPPRHTFRPAKIR